MPTYKIFSRGSGSIVGQETAPTGTQACQNYARSVRSLYPRLSISQIAGKFYYEKIGKASFGGRPRIFDFF